jgi:hypothetical protein
MMKHLYIVMCLMSTMATAQSWANNRATNATTIRYCYHWIDTSRGFLQLKYDWAKTHNGEFSFYTTAGNGAMAGAGIYCAKTAASSAGYGDRVIRLELVDDAVAYNSMTRECSIAFNKVAPQECQKKEIDIEAYARPGDEYYVIRRASAVKSWSSNSATVVADLKAAAADGLPAAVIQKTINAIEAEVANTGARLYVNAQARMSLVKLMAMEDPLSKATPGALLTMLAAYQKSGQTEIPAAKLKAAISKYSVIAVQDPEASADEIGGLAEQFPELNLKEALSKAISENGKVNPVLLVAMADRLKMSVSVGEAKALWQRALTSKASMETLMSVKLTNPNILKGFNAALTEGAGIGKQVKPENAATLISLVANYVDSASQQTADLQKDLVRQMLQSSGGADIASIYKILSTNKNLDSKKVFAEAISEQVDSNKDADPFTLAKAITAISGSFDPDQVKKIAAKLALLPLKDSAKSSIDMLNEYNSGQVSYYVLTPDAFFPKLTDRALTEQEKTPRTINVYRLILSEYRAFFEYYIRKNTRDAKDTRDIIVRAWIGVLGVLESRHRTEYSSAALQNYMYYAYNSNYGWMNLFLADMQPYGAAKSQVTAMTEVMARSLDIGMTFNLLNAAEEKGVVASNAEAILKSMVTYLNSDEFSQFAASKNFQVSQKEKQAWKNFGKEGARYAADLCNFMDTAEKNMSKMSGEVKSGFNKFLTSNSGLKKNCGNGN